MRLAGVWFPFRAAMLAFGALILASNGCSGGKGGGGAAGQPAGGANLPAGNGSVAVRQSTAKDAVETYFLALAQFDGDALEKIVAPDYQQSAKTLVACSDQFLRKGQELADAIDAKIDKTQAAGLRDRLKAFNQVDRDFLENGRVPWARIKIDEVADKATVTVIGKDPPLNLVKIAGQWYVIPPRVAATQPDEFARLADRTKADLAKFQADADEKIARIRAGRMTRQELSADGLVTTQP